jgi:pilus assembly protein FimV
LVFLLTGIRLRANGTAATPQILSIIEKDKTRDYAMVRVRKLVLAIAAASAFTSGTAHALGLGEVSLKSSLSQPLSAEIDLLEVRDLTSTEIIPRLASPEDFSKAGVDRDYFLTDLKFTPIVKPNGKSVIRVTSSKPVREPYLNFLVEVVWPNGRLLREYTVLLDPPLYSPQTVVAAAPQLPAAAPAPRPQAAASAPRPLAAAPVPAPAAPASSPAPSRAVANDQYTTTADDTLWEIAQRTRQGGSVHQAMLAIQELNPDAFIGGNINRLKSGQVLRLPNDQQIEKRSPAEAIAQVAEQNAAWRGNRSVAANPASSRQLDATKRGAAGAAPAEADKTDTLKLVSPEAGKASSGSDAGSGDSKALSDKLAVTQESLDSTRRENDELKGRMTDLQSQLDKLQRLIQLKDDQMAKLQADLAAKNAVAATPPAPNTPTAPEAAKPVAPEQTPAPAPAAPAPTPSAETPAPAPEVAPVAPEATAPDTAAPDDNYSEDADKPAPQTQTPAPAAKPDEPKATDTKPEKPAKPATPVAVEPEQSLLDKLFANPIWLAIMGGIVLLIGLLVLSRRNAMKEAELQNSLAAGDDGDTFDTGTQDLGDSFGGLDDPVADLDETPAAEERVVPQTADVLGEADIYIAYGRFNQAAELLENAINDEPQRSDLRLKLMEVYAELGDRDGFVRQERELQEIGDSAAEVERLKSRYPGIVALGAMGAAGFAAAASADDLDDFNLDDLSLDESPAPAAAPTADDAFDLSLDDLELPLDDGPAGAERSDEFTIDTEDTTFTSSSQDDEMDFDFDLQDEPGKATAATPSLSDDELADFSLDLEEDSKPATVASADDDFTLGLDDDEPFAPSLPAEPGEDFASLRQEPAVTTDFELPADFDLSLPEEDAGTLEPTTDSFAAQLDQVTSDLQQSGDGFEPPIATDEDFASTSTLDADDDFDFLSGTDETATKLDLARAYIDMGDTEGARDILDEVVAEGNDTQQQEARDLIAKLV